MKAALSAVVLALLAGAATPAPRTVVAQSDPPQPLDFGRGYLDLEGGKVHSPDGLWEISAAPMESDFIGVKSPVILNGPGVRNRVLMLYEHEAQVLWPAGSGRVVIVENPHDGAQVHVFALARIERPGPDRVQADIDVTMKLRPPPLAPVMGRFYTVGNLDGALCLYVEWLGPPPGPPNEDGSFDVREASFRIDLEAKHAIPIPDCPVLTNQP